LEGIALAGIIAQERREVVGMPQARGEERHEDER
jgi:hypothetical protein